MSNNVNIFNKRIKEAVKSANPGKSRLEMENAGLVKTPSSVLKGIGKAALRLDGINVWGKEKVNSEKMPDFAGARFGSAEGITEPIRALISVLGHETKPDRQVGFTSIMVAGLEAEWRLKQSQKPIAELGDKSLDSFNFTGTLAIGHGDVEGIYGAGPTRDLRRAYLGPIAVVFVPKVEVLSGMLKTPTQFISELIGRAEANYTVSYPESGNAIKLGADESCMMEIEVINLSREKKGLWGGISGDVILTINGLGYSRSCWETGHKFLPEEIRDTSPFFGGLRYFMGGSAHGGVQEAAKKWIEGEIAKFMGIVKKIIPPGFESKVVGAVIIENS